MNLAIFRRATCCGLRASEICGLKMSHVRVGVDRPYIYVPKEITKGRFGKRRARRIPLWWDQATLVDLSAWRLERQTQGAAASSPGDDTPWPSQLHFSRPSRRSVL